MDEMLRMLSVGESASSVVTLWSLVIGLIFSALLSAGVGMLYRKVQAEASYSQSLVHTFVMISMITALIMLVIGSNIARAFSLVGALSIIRFRTALKSPMDVTFVFFSIAIGMACGTRFYAIAIVGFLIIAAVILLLNRTNFASYPPHQEFLLAVTFHMNTNYEAALSPILEKYFYAFHLSYMETVRQGTLREVVYSVRPKEETQDQEVVDAITRVNENLKVSYRSIRYAVEVP